jgi:hypothetical protein
MKPIETDVWLSSTYSGTKTIFNIHTPKYSDWKIQMFPGTHCRPLLGGEPNRFHRWMHKLFFGFEWIYDPQKYL